MSIPAIIESEWTALQTQVTAATPLTSASRATVIAIQLNAGQLVSDVQSALVAPNNLLDTWTPASDPVSIASGILSVYSASQDQSNLSLMRGIAGRVASNVDQLV